jgi:hypothetical protein
MVTGGDRCVRASFSVSCMSTKRHVCACMWTGAQQGRHEFLESGDRPRKEGGIFPPLRAPERMGATINPSHSRRVF